MVTFHVCCCSGNVRLPIETMRLILATFAGAMFGYFLGIILPNLSAKIWIPTNPKGAEVLPPGIVSPTSDIYPRRLWGKPSEDLAIVPKYLVAFTVGYEQKQSVNAAVEKASPLSLLSCKHIHVTACDSSFYFNEWDEFEWSRRAIHVSARKQSKWWYAKRFLHPDIVAPYDYIFIWDEDLGVQHFNAEEYLKIVRKHGLEISQPGLDPRSVGRTWEMTMKKHGIEVHKKTEERPGWCTDSYSPPCAAYETFVEIRATVFSRNAWRCVWHMIQNDLVHGWGLDFNMRRCVETPHEKIGVVDAQWIVHEGIPTQGNQGPGETGMTPLKGVRTPKLPSLPQPPSPAQIHTRVATMSNVVITGFSDIDDRKAGNAFVASVI
ncbi:hypothetical protein V6N11_043683 [Hibiscus sabdariffa]|uniref:Uncharacterized protein n=1 Tax=Hibiscus sabdariffa TaxID=183260 RepID=A0ABR2RCY5_9ROSI